jgi:hypothetical protein
MRLDPPHHIRFVPVRGRTVTARIGRLPVPLGAHIGRRERTAGATVRTMRTLRIGIILDAPRP